MKRLVASRKRPYIANLAQRDKTTIDFSGSQLSFIAPHIVTLKVLEVGTGEYL